MSNEAGKLDMEDLSRSLTGFDEIAIQRLFGQDFTALPGTLTARALLFVARRRDGMGDADAYRAVMDLPISQVEAAFVIPEEAWQEAGKARARRETMLSPTS